MSTNEELVEGFQQGQRELIEDLLKLNDGILRKVASKYQALACFDDLYQECYFALEHAAKLYDPSKGVSFVNYLFRIAKGYCLKYLSESVDLVKRPRYLTALEHRHNKYCTEYRLCNGRDPSDLECMKALGLSYTQYRSLQEAEVMGGIKSINEGISEDESLTLGDTIPDPNDLEGGIVATEDFQEMKKYLWDSAEKNDCAEIFDSLYGGQRTIKETEDFTGIPSDEIRRRKSRAFRRMKKDPKLRRYFDDYLTSIPRRVGLREYLVTFTSEEELFVIEKENKKSL